MDSEGYVWHFTAMDWDKVIYEPFHFNFLAHNWHQGLPSAEIHVCGDGEKPGATTTQEPTTEPATSGPTDPTESTTEGETNPTIPPDNDLCDGPSGRNVNESKQTKDSLLFAWETAKPFFLVFGLIFSNFNFIFRLNNFL